MRPRCNVDELGLRICLQSRQEQVGQQERPQMVNPELQLEAFPGVFQARGESDPPPIHPPIMARDP